ncbi:uncharacterized protein LOC110051763 [Orbicella faveolata]|uniref:uncharacterized protein LOC110051763 n=1 Tax=Orbicella faveolata TaxID=48498 RepID=UPI0009E2AF2D|nr:uncharacterized protein LOC110051763 [Orbicella faveolata]
MCGSLLSKFKSANKIDPAMMIFTEPRQAASKMELANQDAACFQDREFWKDEEQQGESSVHSLAAVRSKSSLSEDSSSQSDDSSQEEIEAAMRALANERVSAPPVRSNRNNRLRAADRNRQLVDTAFEILAFQAYGNSSSSNTVRAVQPLSSTDSTKVQTAVAFDIPVGEKKTVYPPARVPRRFRKRKVAPEHTLEDMKEKMRAAEERKLKELQRIRECARSRAGVSRPHPAETSAQATAAKIAAKQAAADSKRNEEMEKKKQAGNRASRNRSRIAAAQAFAKTQLQSSTKRKVDETEKRKQERQQKIDKQNKLRGKYAKKIKDRVRFLQCYFLVRNCPNS